MRIGHVRMIWRLRDASWRHWQDRSNSGPLGSDSSRRRALTPRREAHLSNVRQLTDGGENAEAYFSFDGDDLIFQSTRDGGQCDQIYAMKADGSGLRRVSNGEGRTTCSFFYPGKRRVLYASTHLGGQRLPPEARFQPRLRLACLRLLRHLPRDPDGSGLTRFTTTPGYDAEATISRDGRIVFTSVRDGDMEIYSMNGDGGDCAPPDAIGRVLMVARSSRPTAGGLSSAGGRCLQGQN